MASSAAPHHKHSCVLCARRKIKCDKQDPRCSNCSKSHAECIYQAPHPPQRRKRQTDDELISRLNHYEELLRSHKIDFKPINNVWTSQPVPETEQVTTSRGTPQSATVTETVPSPSVQFGVGNLWSSLSAELRNPPMQRLPPKWKVYETQALNSSTATKKLSGIEAFLLDGMNHEPRHPEPRHIFRLWQIFVENVNPMTKILHVPTFQQRIFEVSWNIPSISKPTQAIMFAVYTLAITSVSSSECKKLFDQEKDVMLEQYRRSTIQSLIAAELLSTRDIEVLQAFTLFLLADPEADSTVALTALAVRIGQRMGMHRDKLYSNLSFFEKEMRIRLWWQIRGLDARARHQVSGCLPCSEFGDIRVPLNANDSELHPNMAEAPVAHTGTTEMLFCLLKYEVPLWFRTSSLASKVFNQSIRTETLLTSGQPMEVKDQAIEELEKITEEKYLRHCDPRIPLHFISLTVARLGICRMRFMAHHPRNQPDGGASMSQKESDMLFQNGVKFLQLDLDSSRLQFSPQFFSHISAKSQMDAFIYVVSELRHRVTGDLVATAWKLIGQYYDDYRVLTEDTTNTFYVAIGDLTLVAWENRQRELLQRQGARNEEITPPFIYSLMSTRKKEAAEITIIQPLGGFGGSTMLGLGGDGHLPGAWDPSTTLNPNFSMSSDFGQDHLDWGYWNEFLQV